MEPLLALNNVEVIYNDVFLVRKGMSLKVEPGKIVDEGIDADASLVIVKRCTGHVPHWTARLPSEPMAQHRALPGPATVRLSRRRHFFGIACLAVIGRVLMYSRGYAAAADGARTPPSLDRAAAV